MLLGIYVFCLALGGILIGASIFLGGHGHDGDHNFDHGLDHNLDHSLDHGIDKELPLDKEFHFDKDFHVGDADGHEAEAGPSSLTEGLLLFLSIRFWTFALGSFGLTGLLLQLLGVATVVGLPVALVTGFCSGLGVAWLFRYLKRTTVGRTSSEQLQGCEAIVLLTVGPGREGKVRLILSGQDLDMPAVTDDGHVLEARSRVLVVRTHDGIAHVSALPGLLAASTAELEESARKSTSNTENSWTS